MAERNWSPEQDTAIKAGYARYEQLQQLQAEVARDDAEFARLRPGMQYGVLTSGMVEAISV